MNYQMIQKETIRIVGYAIELEEDLEEGRKKIPEFWNQLENDGSLSNVYQLMGEEIPGVLGVSIGYGEGKWMYMIAVATNKPVPKGMLAYDIPATKWAVFADQGPMPNAIQELHTRIFTEWLPVSGYEYANLPDIEVYLNNDSNMSSFEVWFPVK